jgi:hypothetical protein
VPNTYPVEAFSPKCSGNGREGDRQVIGCVSTVARSVRARNFRAQAEYFPTFKKKLSLMLFAKFQSGLERIQLFVRSIQDGNEWRAA